MPVRRYSPILGVCLSLAAALAAFGVQAGEPGSLAGSGSTLDPAVLLDAAALEAPASESYSSAQLAPSALSDLGQRTPARLQRPEFVVALPPDPEEVAGQSLSRAPAEHQNLVGSALALIGVHYRRAGESPQTGFDCSGFVRYVFHDAAGLDLPHRAFEISRLGVRVARDELRPGDVIFFNTLRRAFSHVGIYIGDGQFVHAPASGGNVRVESLDVPYWTKRFNGARRIDE
jgi:cell wall-associated NlpC family hydrolase